MKNSAKYIFLSFILAAGIFWVADGAKAAPNSPALEVQSADPIFKVTNAAPGQEVESKVTILNHGPHTEKFTFEIQNEKASSPLADFLFFSIKDDAGVCLFGCDKSYSIRSLEKKEILVEKIQPHSTNAYQFILTFDKNAGNQFQSMATGFDIKLGYSGKRPGGGGGNGGGNGNGNGNGGPGGFTGLVRGAVAGITGGGTVAGEENAAAVNEQGQVQGEEAQPGIVEGDSISVCQSWPKWIWIVLLVAYFAAFFWRTFQDIKIQIEKRELRWKWQAILAAAVFLIWYFFDKCREFQWFVIIALVGSAAVYLCYLYLFKKNIQKKNAEIDSGSGQAPPQPPSNLDQ